MGDSEGDELAKGVAVRSIVGRQVPAYSISDFRAARKIRSLVSRVKFYVKLVKFVDLCRNRKPTSLQ